MHRKLQYITEQYSTVQFSTKDWNSFEEQRSIDQSHTHTHTHNQAVFTPALAAERKESLQALISSRSSMLAAAMSLALDIPLETKIEKTEMWRKERSSK